MGCGAGAAFGLAAVLIRPPRYDGTGCFGEVAEETEEES